MEYFISDTHFGHKSTLLFPNNPRPFSSVEEMNQRLIDNWNSIITPEDTVYHLGDFAYKCSNGGIKKIFNQLNGNIVLIKGNHDGRTLLVNKQVGRFQSVEGWLSLELYEHKFFLCHFPVFSWYHKEKGSIHIHGHVHSQLTDFKHPNLVNVCCDLIGFKPISILDIIATVNLNKLK